MKLNILAKDIKSSNYWKMDLDYANRNCIAASIFTSEGNLHPYPAKAVPDMVHELLVKIKQVYEIDTVLDPFVGSGTVALESKILGLDFYGSDLNPLAVLLARTKSLSIKDSKAIRSIIEDFILELKEPPNRKLIKIESFNNITYWFKRENIVQLSILKAKINSYLETIDDQYREIISLIVLTAFSSTIRESSLTRNDEFKLYRMPPADIKKFNINSLDIFKDKIINLLDMLHEVNETYKNETISKIYFENAKTLNYLKDKKISLVLTSPPYGDSRSTVSYGQFSRLSIQWMADLLNKYLQISTDIEDCDEVLLGGKSSISSLSNDYIQNQNLKVQDASASLKQLMRSVNGQIQKELTDLNRIKLQLVRLISGKKQGNAIDYEALFNNEALSILINERIRLSVYRELNKDTALTKKEVKSLTKLGTETFISELTGADFDKRNKREQEIDNILLLLRKSINRKMVCLPKRGEEILKFFVDLYEVVCQTDQVLKDDGIQAWIVGHRTVLGKLNVRMADILIEWFTNLGYSQIALIKRKYHFKRLPHHINSTLTRNKEIKTMMEEHVLIVQKKKNDSN